MTFFCYNEISLLYFLIICKFKKYQYDFKISYHISIYQLINQHNILNYFEHYHIFLVNFLYKLNMFNYVMSLFFF